MSKVEVDPRGWPDYTYPMTIIGQELNVAIDIAAQSLPTLDIHIASSAVTLNINIESISEGVTFNVAQSGTWTINAVQTGSWTVNIGAPLDAEGNVETSIVKSVQLDVNIAASAATLNVAIQSSTVTLNVNVESIGEGVVFNVAQSGTWTVNAAQTGDWNINIESVSAGVTFNVNIESISEGVTFNVAQSGAWTINAVQSGDWNINIESISEGVTLNVNIASASVAINIKTETGANIVIDKLVESAYTEERRYIQNHGTAGTLTALGTTYYRGKFFPRGCRGLLNAVHISCDNPDTTPHEIYIYISPYPGLAPIITATLTVPADAYADWRSVPIYKFWNYDSLFIWIIGDSDSYPRVMRDSEEPYDYYYSTDGTSWTPGNLRWWIRLDMAGQTVGDLPVSGTLNTIEVPNVSTYVESGEVAVPPGEEVTVAEVSGAGRMINCFFRTGYNGISYRIYIDDVKVWDSSMIWLKDYGLDNAEEKLRLLKYDETNDIYALWDTRPFPFTRKLEVRAVNPSTSPVVVEVKFNAELIG